MSILQRRGVLSTVPEARGRDRHCVQPDVVSSAVRGRCQCRKVRPVCKVGETGRARSAASARRQGASAQTEQRRGMALAAGSAMETKMR